MSAQLLAFRVNNTTTESLPKDYRAITVRAAEDRTFAGKRCSDDARVVD
jgi:hypothetical protein